MHAQDPQGRVLLPGPLLAQLLDLVKSEECSLAAQLFLSRLLNCMD